MAGAEKWFLAIEGKIWRRLFFENVESGRCICLFKEHLLLLALGSRCSVHSMELLLHVRVSLFNAVWRTRHSVRVEQTPVINNIYSFIHSFLSEWSFHLLFDCRHQGHVFQDVLISS